MRSPYSQSEFVKIVSNLDRLKEPSENPRDIVALHQELFLFLDRQASIFYFIHDFIQFKYLMYSKSVNQVLGPNMDVIFASHFGHALAYFHPEDRENIRFIHKELFDFFYQQPIGERKKMRFDFNYRLLNSNGGYTPILQQSIFNYLVDGKPVYDFSTCTDISSQKRNSRLELAIYKLDEQGSYQRVHQYIVPQTIGFGLSETEFNILKWVSEGLSSKQIALKCSRSLHTVNNHRRSILSKTQSNTLSEAILKVDI